MEDNNQKRKFGLIPTVAMIVGIVIGSGIFFKTPEVLMATDGNIVMGAFAFIIAAISIIFGGLTIAQYSAQDDKIGGIITYCEVSWGKNIGFLAGWFQTILYYPALLGVISWVGASYTMGLFGADSLLTSGNLNPNVWLLAFAYLIFFFVFNTFQTISAGKFQSFSMFAKLLALVVLGVAGLMFGNPSSITSSYNAYPTTIAGFQTALIAVAFAFDGWMIAPSIAHEIKNPQKNLTKALIIAPICIAIIYLLYYFGISAFVGSEAIINGADPLAILANSLFGDIGMRIVYLFVVISVLGTLNGITLGYIRLPYALAIRNQLPFSKQLSKINKKYDIPVNSSIFTFILSIIYLILHWCSLEGVMLYNLTIFAGLEVDSLPIVTNYLFLTIMYFGVIFKPSKVKTTSFVTRYVYPTLAIIGAFIIMYAGASKPQFNIYLLISIGVILIGVLIKPKKSV